VGGRRAEGKGTQSVQRAHKLQARADFSLCAGAGLTDDARMPRRVARLLATRGAVVDEKDAGGFSVSYGQEDSEFPVYAMAALAAACLAAGWFTSLTIWFALGIVATGFAYYNLPLLETKRPVIGANQYGVFVQSFGLIRWRAVDRIDLVAIAERMSTVHELQIGLNAPVTSALVADWRKQPFYRSLMRLPWSMTYDNKVRVRLDQFGAPPEEIHRTLLRMWRYFRS
jgi:hypothetical protein